MNSHTPCPVESPKKAIEYHHLLRERETSALNYGRFYQRLLEARVFATQRELSIALSVPEGHVSKALKSARLPTDLLRAFGSEAHVSFRVAEALAELVKVVGVQTLTMRAILLGQRPDLTANQILETLARTEPPSHLPQQIRMSVGRGGRYIRKRAI
jgi:ParB family chromosome partitioning protein